ncbi:MAG: hypothetical protein WC299_12925, partial [Kiritimatiellia bacterium]
LIMTADELTNNVTSLVLLKNTAGFVKFGDGQRPDSNLTKSPPGLSPCFRDSVVDFIHSATANSMVT